ncbi:MAG: enoyl-CoA hydratase-related protein [Pseudomonadota bacterium]|nr:enoyl-CoA hydratase-related protein [Pseudomonadota bacterium]
MRSYDQYETIAVSRAGRILTVTMNRPDVLNATDAVLHRELAEIFDDVAQDEDADIVILTGAGRAFSAGGDTAWMQTMIDDPAIWRRTVREGKKIVNSMLDLDKPLIARVNGPAAGLGATMALFCDVIFAGESARIGDPHVNVGFVAGDGGAVIWPQLIGYCRAKEFLMTGEMVEAKRCAEMGLINYCVPDAELDGAVQKFAERLGRGAMQAIRMTKVSVNVGLKQLVASVLETSIAWESVSNLTRDHQEGVNAFNEKRRPDFTGN